MIRIAALLAFFLAALPAHGEELRPGDHGYKHTPEYHAAFAELRRIASEAQPGDRGYRLKEFQEDYKKLFDQGKCHCKSGECRESLTRPSSRSPVGLAVKVNGYWYDVPKNAWLEPKNGIPAALIGADSHVCAFPASGGGGIPGYDQAGKLAPEAPRAIVECVIAPRSG